jgi:hypothetical protein
VKYAIRIPANDSLLRDIEELLTRPVGRPSHKPIVWYKGFRYQAASWKTCSSPTVFRMFRMRIHLLKPQNWFVVTNVLTVERSHARMAAADPNAYVDTNGLVTTCAHCRCSRRVDSPDQWDFVPEYLQPRLESAVKVSHGLCPVCRAYFYRLN